MKNNKGFVLIETIIVTVILIMSLLFVYSSFTTSFLNEKKRLYYDDIAYIYKTEYIKKIIKENLTESGIDCFNNSDIKLFSIESKYNDSNILKNPNMLKEQNTNALIYNSKYYWYVKINTINTIKESIKKCSKSDNDIECPSNINSYVKNYPEFIEYFKTINPDDIDNAKNSILIVWFQEKKDGEGFNGGSINEKDSYMDNFAWVYYE